MTTSPVVTITDELVAEIERFMGFGGQYIKVSSASLRALLSERAELKRDAERSRLRVKELDLLFGRYLLGMKAAVIEMDHGNGANAAMQWIINGLEGPGELPDESELDAQAFFDREIEPINAEMSKLLKAMQERQK